MENVREFNMDEISLRSIAADVLKNFWVIILAVAAAWLAVGGAQKLMYVPEYTATATLAVNTTGSTGSSYSSLTLTNQMAEVFGEVFSSNVLKENIAKDLGVDQVNGEISTSIIQETNLIVLSVTSTDPRQAYLIISAALDNYDTISEYLISNAVLRMVTEPTVPYAPSNTLNVERVQKLAMAAAFIVSAGLIIFLSIMRFTVKTKASGQRNLDGKILGYIPFEQKQHSFKELLKQKHKSLLISSSMVSVGFSESIRKAATRLNHHMRRKGQKVIMVTSVAENEGKSSVAANLALALAEKDKNVLLIDADLKKPAQYRIFDRPATKKSWLNDYFTGKAEANDLLHFNKQTRLYAIFQDAGLKNSGGLLDSSKMKLLLKACRGSFDYIVLDTPPMALSSDAELLMKQVDLAVMVVRQDWTDIRVINDTADTIRKSGAEFAGFIMNAFHRELTLSGSGSYGNYGHYAHTQKTVKE